VRRRGGGVAPYVLSSIQSSVWTYPADDLIFELHWVRVGSNAFFGALYHPPKSTCKPAELLDYIEACVEELTSSFPAANIVLAGDVNRLSDDDMEERTGLTQLVHQPTRGVNILDRVYVSSPQIFNIIRPSSEWCLSALSPSQRFSTPFAGNRQRNIYCSYNTQLV